MNFEAEYDPNRLPGFGARPEYLSTLHLAADSPDKLRTSDVFRVMEDAAGRGFLEGFAAWLELERPDLATEISECVEDL